MEQKKNRTKFITSVGVLTAVSVVLALFEFPLPLMPPFLKVNFSTLPALVGGFAYGPLAGIAISFIKELIALMRTDTGGVGQLADFIISVSFVGIAAFVYTRNKCRKSAILGMLLASVVTAVVGGVVNYFILIPFYSNLMPLEQIFAMCGERMPLIHDMFTYALYGAVPFNLVKALMISVITFFIYKHISRLLH